MLIYATGLHLPNSKTNKITKVGLCPLNCLPGHPATTTGFNVSWKSFTVKMMALAQTVWLVMALNMVYIKVHIYIYQHYEVVQHIAIMYAII